MPMVTVKVIEGVFTAEQKREIGKKGAARRWGGKP